ncbi:hypothetical protein ABS71_04910 [bacterium SCN 62-11]|nr:hypothetical protein [Candidatus Eremiobacteraeota bacterium]ODT75095.1 MAG: hypothetical protein ABS71_04910 [bacterium SCN 62-11]
MFSLSACAQAQVWPQGTEFAGPPELLRAARDLRLDIGDLGPAQFRGGSNFSNGGGFTAGDMSKFSQRISYFERACMQIHDVRDTRRAFADLDQAYQRAWRPGPYGTASVRDIGKIMERLERFYAEVDKQLPPQEPPQSE